MTGFWNRERQVRVDLVSSRFGNADARRNFGRRRMSEGNAGHDPPLAHSFPKQPLGV
jgi:hypothetical protein